VSPDRRLKSGLRSAVLNDKTMDNVLNCDSYIKAFGRLSELPSYQMNSFVFFSLMFVPALLARKVLVHRVIITVLRDDFKPRNYNFAIILLMPFSLI
jgi:uncharacterized membrane protein